MERKFLSLGLFLLILILFVFSGNTLAQQVPEVFIPEQVFAFDPVWDGDPVTHDFVLINKGTAPLEILKIEND